MLVQLYRDNYTTTPTENLITTIYDGFFDGVENWFSTATIVNTDIGTSNLTSIDEITKKIFSSSTPQSIIISGFFRAKKTGTYRFFTYSNDKNILEIDNDDIIINTGFNQINFSNKSLIAGRYYSFKLYYGNRVFNYPPARLSATVNTTTLSGQVYGNGTYNVSFSSQQSTREARNLFDTDGGTWRPTTIVGAWVQLELPNPIVLGSYQVNTNATGGGIPQRFKLEGSNDNFATSVLLSQVEWSVNQGSKTIIIDPLVNQSFKYFRLTNLEIGYNTSFIQFNYPLMFYAKPELECGYLEPNADGTNGGSTNPDDFIQNATGLTTYYDIDPETQPTLTTAGFPLVIEDDTLQGLFRVSPLAFYSNRTNFTTGKHDILYIASNDLFNNFNGTYKNYIQIHEKPVANDIERKRFTQFSSDMSFECELNGRIEVFLRRGVNEPISWRYAMLILDVERIPTKYI